MIARVAQPARQHGGELAHQECSVIGHENIPKDFTTDYTDYTDKEKSVCILSVLSV
jgi:hypothetical protein